MGIVKNPAEQLEQIIANDKRLEERVKNLEETITAKDAAYAELKTKFEKVEDFLPLVDELEEITHWTVTIRDKKVMGVVLRRATQMYRRDFTGAVNADDDAARRSARLKVDNLIEAMLKFACEPLYWQKIYTAYLSRAR